MFDIMKAVRETAAARSAVTRARRPRPELIRLRVEIERTKCAIEAARNHFEHCHELFHTYPDRLLYLRTERGTAALPVPAA